MSSKTSNIIQKIYAKVYYFNPLQTPQFVKGLIIFDLWITFSLLKISSGMKICYLKGFQSSRAYSELAEALSR